MSCGICKKDVHDSDMQLELECGKHIAHAVHQSFDCKLCAAQVSLSNDGAAAAARVEKTELERRKQQSASRVNEPLSLDRPQEPGLVGSALALISRHVAPLFARAGVAPESLPPRELLKQRIPLSDLVNKVRERLFVFFGCWGIMFEPFKKSTAMTLPSWSTTTSWISTIFSRMTTRLVK